MATSPPPIYYNYGNANIDDIDGSVESSSDILDIGNISFYDLNEGVTYRPSFVAINTGAGDDSISNYGSSVTISGGEGNDKIYNNGSGDSVTISGGKGNDSIDSSGDSVTISGGAGDDRIVNKRSRYVTIEGGAGDDYIYNAHVTLQSYGWYDNQRSWGINDDTQLNYVYDSSNDLLGESYMPIPDYYYDETVYGGNVLMIGSDGNDTVHSEGGDNVTLNGGSGDDILIGGTNSNSKPSPSYMNSISYVIEPAMDVFVYNSGNDTIQNYQSGEVLRFVASYTGWTTDNNDLVINAAEGSVRIIDTKNKLVEVADGEGNIGAHVYWANDYEGAIDGRGYGGFEVLTGADNVSNQIFAGDNGSSLWGGNNSKDELYGGAGQDEFVYKYGNGNDNIFQSSNEDTVNLLNISLSQIAGAEITDNGVNLQFTDGGSLNINGQVGTFVLEGQRYGADYQNKSWYSK